MIIPSILRRARAQATCSHCRTALEYERPSSSDTAKLAPGENVQVQCAACDKVFNVTTGGAGQSATGAGKPKSKRIGTDDNPVDLTYYETLGVSVTATEDEIKRAYRKLAIIWHPDKRPGDLEAEEKFKQIAQAYQTLVDKDARRKYNEFGQPSQQSEEGVMDPEALFASLFGGERFQDIIGTISIGAEMKTALQQDEGDDEATPAKLTGSAKVELSEEQKAEKARKAAEKAAKDKAASEERARIRDERVKVLSEKLRRKLSVFVEQAKHGNIDDVRRSVRQIWSIEAEELKGESYGVELLHTVGFVYAAKAKHHLASATTFWGMGGWLHSARNTAHVFNETVSTLRAAYALKDVFAELSLADEKGLSDEKKKELEERAAQKGLEALFKGAKLEVESVEREVCDSILTEGVTEAESQLYAEALIILGDVYTSVRKEGGNDSDADYVNINPRRASNPVPPPSQGHGGYAEYRPRQQ